ncbi:lamin tail domain-containing protein [Candidatus Peregrinibacteria bacterium]|nr:lamin tail domain-containing protein [Candidatus Peregrinibacteria bacterium]
MRKILIALALLFQIPLAHAYVECVSTPTGGASTALANLSNSASPEILINEVSFKDKTADFIELYIKDDKNSGLGASIKDFSIKVDGTEIKKIASDILLKTNGFILLTFKSSATDEAAATDNILKLYTTRDGLVSTTSVIALNSPAASIADAICWDDGTPTETQQTKITEIKNAGAWTGACVSSAGIKDNESIGRNISSDDTNQTSDWYTFATSTPAATNIQQVQPEPPPAAPVQIVINEFMPDPEGTDTGNEWIELKNLGATAANLIGYKIDDSDSGSSAYTFPDTTLAAGEAKAFYSSETKIVLNNDTDRVRLFNTAGALIDEILYEKPLSGQSFSRDSSGQWSITTTPTPNASNTFSNSENSSVTCNKISLANAVAGGSAGNKTPIVKTGAEIAPNEVSEYTDEVSITEIFPNPAGTDTAKEWVEIYNESNKKINLGNWEIQTDNKRKYAIKDKTFISANAYLAVNLKIPLKNSGAHISLIDPEGNIVDEVDYPQSRENLSYAKTVSNNSTAWEWTKDITPSKENPIYETFSAQITDASSKNQFSALKDDKRITISYSEETLPAALAANVLQTGENFSIKAREIGGGAYELQSIEPAQMKNGSTSSQPENKPSSNIYLAFALGISIAATIGAILYIKKNV